MENITQFRKELGPLQYPYHQLMCSICCDIKVYRNHVIGFLKKFSVLEILYKNQRRKMLCCLLDLFILCHLYRRRLRGVVSSPRNMMARCSIL